MLPDPRVCPQCRLPLTPTGSGPVCASCGTVFPVLDGGFVDLMPPGDSLDHTPFDHYVAEQVGSGAARAERWVLRQVGPSDRRVLDVGCGTGSIGVEASAHRPELEVWGVDLPGNLPGWRAAGADPARVLAGSALQLPFADRAFDLVWSLGVIEHIGEPAPPAARQDDRMRYVREMLRVVRPGGRVILVAPHKWFPLDPAHDWSETERGRRMFERTHLCLHRTWGPHALMSHAEVARMARRAGAARVRPLRLEGYFSFERTGGGAARRLIPVARTYLARLPAAAGATPLAPFLAVELTR